MARNVKLHLKYVNSGTVREDSSTENKIMTLSEIRNGGRKTIFNKRYERELRCSRL